MFEKVKAHPPAHAPARPMAAAGAPSCASAAAASGAAAGATVTTALVLVAKGAPVGGRGSSLPTTLVSSTIWAT